jgi:hypothetical protein
LQPPELARVRIDLNDPRRMRNEIAGPVSGIESEASSEHENGVRGHALAGETVEALHKPAAAIPVDPGERPEPLEIRKGWYAARLDQPGERFRSLHPAQLRAHDDHRPVRFRQNIERELDVLRARTGSLAEPDDLRRREARLLDRRREHVPWQVDQHRPARRSECDADRLVDQARDVVDGKHAMRPFRDRRGDRHLIDPGLERVRFVVPYRSGAGQEQHRGPIEKGIRDRRHRIREPAAGGDESHAEPLPGPGIALRGMTCRGLVPRVDDRQLPVEAGLEDRIDVSAVQAEDHLDAGLGERRDDQLASRDQCHPLSVSFDDRRGALARAAHTAIQPPSATIACPVM